MKSNCREQPCVQLVRMEAHSEFPPTSIYYPPTKLREGNVYSHVCLSFILSTDGVGSHVTSDYWPWCIGSHYTCTPSPDIEHLCTYPTPPCPTSPLGYVQTCSTWIILYRDPTSRAYSILFIMKHVRLTSGRFASYWNAFLFTCNFELINFTCQMHSELEEPLTSKGKCPTLHFEVNVSSQGKLKVNNFSKMTTATWRRNFLLSLKINQNLIGNSKT